MKEYINGPKAETYISFKSGATLIEIDKSKDQKFLGKKCAYFKFDTFFNFLKSKELRIRADKTSWMIVDVENIKGFFVRKRFPKKKKDNNKNAYAWFEDIERKSEVN